jgi:RhtB (resistance to homoserine/threonine) family protein
MLGTHDLLIFILAGWLLNVTPGPDTALIVARSTQLGLRGGVAAVAGVGCGIMVHVTAAALGISALIAASATAFDVVKFCGAAYLVYIGARMMLTRRAKENLEAAAAGIAPAMSFATVLRQGFVTNALNPKVALFFLAFLPQFVDQTAPSKALALFVLGVIFNANGTLWNLVVAVVTARATRMVRGARSYQRFIDGTIGAIFIAFGIKLALFQRG